MDTKALIKRLIQVTIIIGGVSLLYMYREPILNKLGEIRARSYGEQLLFEKKPERALVHYEAAVTEFPNVGDFHLKLAPLYQKKKQWQKAQSAYDTGLQLRPKDLYGRLNYARMLTSRGSWNAALIQYKQALLIFPKESKIPKELGDFYRESAKVAKEEKKEALHARLLNRMSYYYEEALKLKPDYFEAEYGLALSCQEQGAYTEAAQHYCRALSMQPSKHQLQYNLGMSLMQADYEAVGVDQMVKAAREMQDPALVSQAQALRTSLLNQGHTLASLEEERHQIPPGLENCL